MDLESDAPRRLQLEWQLIDLHGEFPIRPDEAPRRTSRVALPDDAGWIRRSGEW